MDRLREKIRFMRKYNRERVRGSPSPNFLDCLLYPTSLLLNRKTLRRRLSFFEPNVRAIQKIVPTVTVPVRDVNDGLASAATPCTTPEVPQPINMSPLFLTDFVERHLCAQTDVKDRMNQSGVVLPPPPYSMIDGDHDDGRYYCVGCEKTWTLRYARGLTA